MPWLNLTSRMRNCFRALCGFVWTLGESSQPLVFDYLDPIYKDRGLRFENLQHLDAIGLLRLEVDSYRLFFDEDEKSCHQLLRSVIGIRCSID